MKKKLLHIFTVGIFFVVAVCIFSISTSAAGVSLHRCSGGPDPMIEITYNAVYVTGCNNCHTGFAPNYPSVSLKTDEIAGKTFDAGQYSIPYSIANSGMQLLAGTDDEIVFLYAGREQTYYPLSETKPTQPGDYSVRLSTRKLYNYYLETGKTTYVQKLSDGQTRYTAVMTSRVDFSLVHVHKFAFSANGYDLCIRCSECGEQGSVTLDVTAGFCVGHFEESDVPLSYGNWSACTADDAVLLYEGRENTAYPLSSVMPSQAGRYTVSLALKSAWMNGSVSYRTTPVPFTIDDECHKWTYTAVGCSIEAACQYCDAAARVVLDSSAVYENARQLDADGLRQELFYAENWNSYKDIAPFAILYDGKEIYDLDNGTAGKVGTAKLYSSTIAPTGAGNYVAYVAILKDRNDVSADSVIVKSTGLPFYVAGYSFKRCKVVEYGANEIALFTKPTFSNNVYYVGTLSELLWCVYNQTTDMNIVLTNDIVVNPITVTESGNVSTGALVIYKWKGFGTKNARFSGTIDGGGHTIYGLYMPQANPGDWVSGFICWGRNVVIKDLTIESSLLKASNGTGAFMGELEVSGSTSTLLSNCRSLHNLVQSGTEAGGLIGWISGTRSSAASSFFTIENCMNNSYVTAPCAGGIVGRTAADDDTMCRGLINRCSNYGSINGTDYAGGIFGSMTVWNSIGFSVTNCLNAGSVKANAYESGIICELKAAGGNGALTQNCINVSGNVNIGELHFRCSNANDIIAKTENDNYCEIGLLKLENNRFSKAKAAYPAKLTNAPAATKLTNKEIQNGKPCEILGHVQNVHYSDVTVAECETGGSKQVCCATCGEVLEIIITSPHGHMLNAFGDCIYCTADNSNVASLFGTGTWMIAAVAAVVIGAAGAAAVIFKKKKA